MARPDQTGCAGGRCRRQVCAGDRQVWELKEPHPPDHPGPRQEMTPRLRPPVPTRVSSTQSCDLSQRLTTHTLEDLPRTQVSQKPSGVSRAP